MYKIDSHTTAKHDSLDNDTEAGSDLKLEMRRVLLLKYEGVQQEMFSFF